MSGAGSGEGEEFGALLRQARLEAGLSQRDLAERLGVSHIAVSNAEAGADLRHQTLRKYLKALPALTPRDLLPGGSPVDLNDPNALWRYYRDTVGYECRETHDHLVIAPNGARTRTIVHRGLKSIRSEPGALKLLLGLERAVYSSETDLRGLRAHSRRDPEGNEVRVRTQRGGAKTRHAIHISPEVARDGLTLERTIKLRPTGLSRAAHFKMLGIPDHGSPIHTGTAKLCKRPTRKFFLKVSFPAGFLPLEADAHVWPQGMVPDPEMFNSAAGLHPDMKLRRNKARSELSLRVDQPLMGFVYSIGWALP